MFDDTVLDYEKDMFVQLSENYSIILDDWNYGVAHAYILFKVYLNTKTTKFINAYKGVNSLSTIQERPSRN